MRKLIMWNIITLDGYFEGDRNWELQFLETVWGPELEKISIEQLKSADYLVFGRVTYEGMAAYWKTAKGEIAELMNEIPKLVCSRTLSSVDWNNTTLLKGNPSAEISKLKAQGGGDMYVFGSANLSVTFMNDNLFDEYRIAIAPVIAGRGRPLFEKDITPRTLKLVSSQTLLTGCVVMTFRVTDTGPFYHGTKADLQVGDLLQAGFNSNYKHEVIMNHIYFTALINGAGLAASLAQGMDGHERVYIVEPTGSFENDPNVTDKKFPGNPTRSYRSSAPLKIVGEVTDWVRLTPEELQSWREKIARIRADSKAEIIN